MSLFAHIQEAPRDPILGITEVFNADPRPHKINLSVGVYLTDEGKIPLLKSVQQAELRIMETPTPRAYLPIQGAVTYTQAVQTLVFGAENSRVVTAQALGGTGGLKLGADFLKWFFPNSHVAISDPSWENQRALFEAAGFPVSTYRYYDPETHGVDFTGLMASLRALPAQSIVILHACCHNPTGIDLSTAQWTQIIDVCKAQALIPFLDMAYQGFSAGVDADAGVVRLFMDSGLSFLVSNSFSKSCSLYGERVGALSIVSSNQPEANCILSQIKRVIRTNYSNPPTHGSAIVSTLLTRPELRSLWVSELDGMRLRIESMRHALVSKLSQLNPALDFSFINQQRGMFSYSGLSSQQATQLKQDHGIYILPSGRICIAALNSRNIDAVAGAIATVLG